MNCTENYQILDQNDVITHSNNSARSIFKISNSMKIFVVDHSNINENKNLQKALNNYYDEV